MAFPLHDTMKLFTDGDGSLSVSFTAIFDDPIAGREPETITLSISEDPNISFVVAEELAYIKIADWLTDIIKKADGIT